jgi:hypothetical protein
MILKYFLVKFHPITFKIEKIANEYKYGCKKEMD